MTSNSGRDEHCERCGCANNNHTFGDCAGRDKKGSKWEKCTFVWTRCTTGGHNDLAPGVQYIDCQRCGKHPGAPPTNGDFWGTQPDDDYRIYTADDFRIPWPNQEAEAHGSAAKVTGKGKDKIDDEERRRQAGHSRADSGSSEDPLQSNDERYLVDNLAKFNISDKTTLVWSAWSWDKTRWARYRVDSEGKYIYDYQKDSGTWSAWTKDPNAAQYYSSTLDPDGQPYYIYDLIEEGPSTATTSTTHGKGKGPAKKGKGEKGRK